MASVRAVHEYGVGELWLDGPFKELDDAGIEVGNYRLFVPQLNSEQAISGLAPDSQPLNKYFSDPSEHVTGSTESGSRYSVNSVALSVEAEVDTADGFESRWAASGGAEVQAALQETRARVQPIIQNFFAWVRTEGDQPRLGRFESGDIGLVQSGLYLSGQRLTYGDIYESLPRRRHLYMNSQQVILTVDEARNFLNKSIEGKTPALSVSLFADARHDYDGRRQVLIAAMALEVGIKGLLQECSNEDQNKLVDLLLNNPRDYSMGAASLFDKPCAAVTGRSLHADKLDTFKGVHKLFETRNKIAHGGEDVASADQVRHFLAVTADALAWCADVRGVPRG